MKANNPSYAFSYRTRKTQKGVVYDVRFRIVDENGREVQRSLSGFETKTLAKKAYTDFMSSYIAPTRKADAKHVLRFAALRDEYMLTRPNQIKDSTIYEKKSVFALFISPTFEKSTMAAIDKQALCRWQDELWAKQKTDGTYYAYKYLSKIRTHFGDFLRWCSERYGTANYMPEVVKPKRREPPRQMQIWTREEFNQFITVVENPTWRAFFGTLFYAGMRKGEATALLVNDVSSERILVHKSLSRKTTDGTPFKITSTKTEKVRTVPIAAPLKSILADYTPTGAYFFGGDSPLTDTTIKRVFDNYCKQADVRQIRIHELRHSFVSMLVHHGANFAVIADLIGDTIAQVSKTYAHLYAADKMEIMSKL